LWQHGRLPLFIYAYLAHVKIKDCNSDLLHGELSFLRRGSARLC
jgi:hypothetical protein